MTQVYIDAIKAGIIDKIILELTPCDIGDLYKVYRLVEFFMAELRNKGEEG